MDDLSFYVPNVHFEQIPIKNLVSNQDYQRNLSQAHIERAVRSQVISICAKLEIMLLVDMGCCSSVFCRSISSNFSNLIFRKFSLAMRSSSN